MKCDYLMSNMPKLGVDTWAYEDYEYKKIDMCGYVFGIGNLITKKFYSLEYDLALNIKQTVNDNSALLYLLDIWSECRKARNKYQKIDAEPTFFNVAENEPLSPPIKSSLLSQEEEIIIAKAVIDFCKKFALPYNNFALINNELHNSIEIGYCAFFDCKGVWGFSISEFISFADKIYDIYRKWDKFYNLSAESKKQQTEDYSSSKLCDLAYIIDEINNLPLQFKSITTVNKNGAFVEQLCVENLLGLVSFQLKHIISMGENVSVCANPNCSNHFVGRKNRKFCSDSCKLQNHRNKRRVDNGNNN